MSSLATARTRAAFAPARTAASLRPGRLQISFDAALGLVLAAGLSAVAFITTGGTDPGPNTWTEIVLTILGSALAIVVLLWSGRGRAWGAVTLGLFVGLAVLTAASVTWSVQPENSWIEANRTLSYLAVFGGAVALARLMPARWAGLVGATAVLATVIGGYALLAKVFPSTLDASDPFGRLRAPFDYFNAIGLLAALGLPPCLWAGARRERARAVRALAVPAVAILATVIVLSYSRGALLVALAGLALWFATVPLRLRGALVLALGLVGAAALSLYALHTHALTHNLVPLQSRTSAGRGFGVLLAFVLALETVAGLAAAFAMDRAVLPAKSRRRVGTALVTLVAMIPLGALVGLAASSRGLTGEVSHLFSTLTSSSVHSGAPNAPSRLVELGNSRGRYWNEGLKVGEHSLLHGAGALGYATAVTRYTDDARTVPHAHSFVIETFADFGLIGIAVSLALLIAWGLAAKRTLTSPRSRELVAERAGLLTMLSVVVVFGLHSAIDWTWFIPGTALPALACAGWLAGRGPLAEPVGRADRRRRLTQSPGTSAAALGIVAVALMCVWAIWQPLRSADASAAATAALGRGDASTALADAQRAANVDPVTVEPLWQLAAIYSGAGNDRAAHDELVSAVHRQPENPQTWLQLGELDLQMRQPLQALGPLRRALALDRSSAEATDALGRAQAQAAASSQGTVARGGRSTAG